MKGRKIFRVLMLWMILTVFFMPGVPAARAAGMEDPGWQEQSPDVRESGWKKTDGKTYYFDPESGVMCTGFRRINQKLYYFKKNGVLKTGWMTVDGNRYYAGKNGVIQTGWKKINGKTYYFAKVKGFMRTGFLWLDQKRYYFQKNGVLKTGWMTVDGNRYYAGKNGAIQTGWRKIDGKLYYFAKVKGFMRTGFLWLNQKGYYLQENGVLAAGWITAGGKKYYAGTDGVIRTGWQKIGGEQYCFGKTGALQTGWAKDGEDTYYADASGILLTGWQKIGSDEYYFSDSGKMSVGWTEIDGVRYLFDESTGKLDTEKTPRETPFETMCRQIVEKKVKKTDSVNTKLSKLFQYVTWNFSYLRSYNFTGASGWHKTYAYNMLTTKRGNCYSYAAAFAYLAKKATGLPVRVGWGGTPALGGGLTPHGWCEIQIGGVWYVFDPDLYRYVYNGNCYYKTMGQVGGYYYNRHYEMVEF